MINSQIEGILILKDFCFKYSKVFQFQYSKKNEPCSYFIFPEKKCSYNGFTLTWKNQTKTINYYLSLFLVGNGEYLLPVKWNTSDSKNNFKIIKFLTLSCYWKRKLKYWLGNQLFLNFDTPTIHKQKHIKVSCCSKKKKKQKRILFKCIWWHHCYTTIDHFFPQSEYNMFWGGVI